jgi:hypothetical protein
MQLFSSHRRKASFADQVDFGGQWICSVGVSIWAPLGFNLPFPLMKKSLLAGGGRSALATFYRRNGAILRADETGAINHIFMFTSVVC